MKEEKIEELHEETGIAKKTLRMIDRGIEEMENVSNIEEDFPEVFE